MPRSKNGLTKDELYFLAKDDTHLWAGPRKFGDLVKLGTKINLFRNTEDKSILSTKSLTELQSDSEYAGFRLVSVVTTKEQVNQLTCFYKPRVGGGKTRAQRLEAGKASRTDILVAGQIGDGRSATGNVSLEAILDGIVPELADEKARKWNDINTRDGLGFKAANFLKEIDLFLSFEILYAYNKKFREDFAGILTQSSTDAMFNALSAFNEAYNVNLILTRSSPKDGKAPKFQLVDGETFFVRNMEPRTEKIPLHVSGYKFEDNVYVQLSVSELAEVRKTTKKALADASKAKEQQTKSKRTAKLLSKIATRPGESVIKKEA